MMKFLVALAFVAIIGSLGSALFFMMRGGGRDQAGTDKRKGDNMARALAMRIGLSVVLFICLLVSWKMGWIQPTGIPLSPR